MSLAVDARPVPAVPTVPAVAGSRLSVVTRH